MSKRMSGLGQAAKVALGILGALGVVLLLLLVIGLFLPNRVEVTRSVQIPAPTEAVFDYLDDLEAWTEWTPWGDVESTLEGPAAGAGARRVWDDPDLGSGSLTLTEVEPAARVAYTAEVDEGAIRFVGRFHLSPTAEGTTVDWTEASEWGWNPLLGWTGLTLEAAQGRQLEESLARLRTVVTEAAAAERR